jgi:hypothetical protein
MRITLAWRITRYVASFRCAGVVASLDGEHLAVRDRIQGCEKCHNAPGANRCGITATCQYAYSITRCVEVLIKQLSVRTLLFFEMVKEAQ